MTRARPVSPPDYREHRHRWAGLVSDIHAAVAADDHAGRERVWDRAGAALNCWTLPVAYPRGMVARTMAQAALTWSRQTDPAFRAQLTPLLIQTVGLCDELLAAAEAEGAPVAQDEPSARRLPYADA